MTKGERIKGLRQGLGLTMEELGKKIGVSKPTIKRYESGIIDNIPSDKIEALAKALDSTPQYIMGWTDRPELMPSTHALAGRITATVEPDDEMDIWELREQLRRDPAMRTLFDLARRATPSDVRAAAAMLKALEDQSDE